MGLSEKARGKQRAIEPSEAGEPVSEPCANTRDLTVRFTEGIPDLTLQVTEQDTVRDVKHNIRNARPELANRRLKLILAGQLLADTVLLHARLVSLEERQRRATSDAPSEGRPDSSPVTSAWLHCSVGPPLEEGEEEGDTGLQTAQLKPLRGFDRLAAAGFSAQDIANFRLQFHAHSAGDYIDQDFEDDEDFVEHARTLEERWIDSLDGGGPSIQSGSASSTMLNGIGIGFFFPVLPFFWFRAAKPAIFWEDGTEHDSNEGHVFSTRVQVGIVLGFLANCLFGAWIYLLTSP